MVKTFLIKGVQYNSQKELCEAFGVNKDTFSSRLKSGWTTEEALNLVKRGRVSKNSRPCEVTFEGKTYSSYAELCRDKKVCGVTFNRRRRKGFSIEECLYGKDAPFTYKGVKYKNLNALCNATNMGWETVNHRLKLGYTVEQAIEWDECNNSRYKVYYNGKDYKSERNLCEKMGVHYVTFCQRKSRGLSLEECIHGKVKFQ